MKKILTILTMSFFTLTLIGCGTIVQPSNYASTYLVGNFTVIEECDDLRNTYKIVKHDDTGVLYLVYGNTNASTMSPILKADGTPYTIEDVNLRNYE